MSWEILFPTAAGIIITVIGYLIKRSIVEIDKKIDETSKETNKINDKIDQLNRLSEESIDNLRKELYRYKDKAADEFVKKADFILVTSDIGRKLDKVYDILLSLSKGRSC